MSRLLICVLSCILFAGSAFAVDAPVQPEPERTPAVAGHDEFLLTSGVANGLAERETTGPDTFLLYGGPDHPTEGKFQLANGATADWGGGNGLPGGYGGGPDAWTPVDLTYKRDYWSVDTFNAGNLNGNGPGNNAMWCGLPVGHPDIDFWVFAPGYANGWDEDLVYESPPVSDPSAGQTVDLDFFFNYDTEATFDFFRVQYDSAGTWTTVLEIDGSNKDGGGNFPSPGVQFSVVQTHPIVFTGNDYSYESLLPPFGNRIRIRLVFSSDGAWSDQDGLIDTDGAVQVDDIALTHSEGSFFEDFEGAGPYLFEPEVHPFVGDFADVYPRFTDIDPCRENETPVVGFIDYGQIVRNGPGVDGRVSTGGSTAEGIEYGIPGNYVVPRYGGLGGSYLRNMIWSPPIMLDASGPEDDAVDFGGVFFRFDVWAHFPLENMYFYVWEVRSAMPGEAYGEWVDRNFIYYAGGRPLWVGNRFDVSDLIPPGSERIQVALGVYEWHCDFCWPSATPAPTFDNISVYKYRLPGPTLSTRTVDTAQDGFPVNGSIDVSTPASRDALDIPFSMARDVSTGDQFNVPGDSVIVDVASIIGGAVLTDVRMIWALQTNPLFEDALRTAPGRSKDENVVTGPAGTVWTGEVVADSSRTSWGSGEVVDGRFFADLPDVDLMYPGDVLHYYFQATDSDGRISTMPYDTSGFGVFGPDSPYDRKFTVRGLPTLTDTSGVQPEILVINDFGRRGSEEELTTAFRNLGYLEGVHYDTYTVQGPTSGVSNGIGSAGAHGATGAQLAGYGHMFYLGGDLSTWLLSNGSGVGGNDKGDDIGTLEDWHALAGTRNVAYFGDYMAHALTEDSPEGAAYLANTMGVDYIDQDVSDAIGGQLTPVITPSPYGATWFATDFVADGGCLSINEFDQIQPLPGAEAGHYFTSADGTPITDASAGVASVIYPTASGVDITFPYSTMFIQNVLARDVGVSSRTQLFAEVLGLFSAAPGGAPVAVPGVPPIALSAFPNPFNPVTVVKFTAPLGAKGSVKVFNLRGELVRTLHSGEFVQQEFRWDGVDERGASVASGVYVIKAETEGNAQTTKVALVK